MPYFASVMTCLLVMAIMPTAGDAEDGAPKKKVVADVVSSTKEELQSDYTTAVNDATSFGKQREYRQAAAAIERAESAAVEIAGKFPEMRQMALESHVSLLRWRAMTLLHLPEIKDSIPVADLALEVAMRELGKDHVLVPSSRATISYCRKIISLENDLREKMFNLEIQANAAADEKRFDDAIRLAQQLMDIEAGVLGQDHPYYSNSLALVAQWQNESREFDKAIENWERSLSIRKAVLGPSHSDVIQCLDGIASAERGRYQLSEAFSRYQEVAALRRKFLSTTSTGLKGVRYDDLMDDSRKQYTTNSKVTWEPGKLKLGEKTSIQRKSEYRDGWLVAFTPVSETSASEFSLTIGRTPPNGAGCSLVWTQSNTDEDPMCSLRFERLSDPSTGLNALFAGKPKWKRELGQEVQWKGSITTGQPWVIEFSYGYMKVMQGETLRLSAFLTDMFEIEFWEISTLKGELSLSQISDMCWSTTELKGWAQTQLIQNRLQVGRWTQLISERKYTDALPVAQSCLDFMKGNYPETYPGISAWEILRARTHRLLGNAAAAEPLEEAGLKRLKSCLGPKHPHVGFQLRMMASSRAEQGDPSAANDLHERAFPICEAAFGHDHPETAKCLKARGRLSASQGQYSDAIKYYSEALSICEKTLGPEEAEVGVLCDAIAVADRDRGNYQDAKPFFERSLKIAEKHYGVEDNAYAIALDNFAGMYMLMNEFETAERLYRNALRIKKKTNDLSTATSMHNLAGLYSSMGRIEEAESLAMESLRIAQKRFGSNHEQTAHAYSMLALISFHRGDYRKAEQFAKSALQILLQTKGKEHEETAYILNVLATVRSRAGDHAAAENLLRDSIEIYRKVGGDAHPSLPASYRLLGEELIQQGRHDEALQTLDDTLLMLRKRPDGNKLEIGKCLDERAELALFQKRYADSLLDYREAYALKRSVLGDRHASVGITLAGIGETQLMLGDSIGAEESLKSAIQILDKSRGADFPENSVFHGSLGFAYFRNDKIPEATDAFRRSLKLSLSEINHLSGIQSEEKQLDATLKARALPFFGWLSATATGSVSASEAWQPLLLIKGLVTSRSAKIRRALNSNPLYADYVRVGRQLSELTMNPPNPSPAVKRNPNSENREQELRDKWISRRSDLKNEYERIETELARSSSELRQFQKSISTSVTDIVSALQTASTPTALVDVYTYLSINKSGKEDFGELHFVAFVVSADGNVQRVELGPSAPIVDAIATWRKSFGRSQDGREAGQRLRERLWIPIAAHLKDISTVLISPELELCQLPWGALPGKEPGSFLFEELALAVIPTPGFLPELLNSPKSLSKPANLLIAGDIDYSSDRGKMNPDVEPGVALGRGEFRRFSNLPAAGPEVDAVKRHFQDTTGKSVQILRGIDATESSIRDEAPKYEWLHLITHGYFEPAELVSALMPKPTDLIGKHRSLPTAELPGRPGGLGVGLRVENGQCFVAAIVPNGAAGKDGRLAVNDVILEVASGDDGWVDVSGKESAEVSRLIRGPTGTVVRLKVRPVRTPMELNEYKITRAAIPGQSAPKMVIQPDLLSGVVFAGANNEPQPGKDDGILTSLDISGIDLRNVDTVVLSACETGLGTTLNGEGALGLQRAFQVAGAKTVVASLWKVDDQATAMLMDAFYENLWTAKLGKIESLRQAQLKMLREGATWKITSLPRGLAISEAQPKMDGERLPPYYWAAFVLSGDWR